MGVTFNFGKLSITLDKLDKGLKNLAPIFKNIADLELADTKLRFIQEIDPEGKKWEDPVTLRRDGSGTNMNEFDNPWAYVVASNYHATPPGYRWWRRPDKILRDTGTLFNSIQSSYGYNYAIVGTNLEYAKKHQDGIGVKQRKFIGPSKKTKDNIHKAVNAYLKGIIK